MNACNSCVKRLLTLFPLLSLFLLPASPAAFAVSLGDELILSRLGDPVEIEIEVLQWEDMDLERVQISAATQEEYEVFDLTWLPVLDDLNFNLVGPDLDGDVRVLISSRDPLNEPFLELLLVLRWPGGSLRREYVLLFDPPGAPVAVVPVADSPAEPATSPVPPMPPAENPAPAIAERAIESASPPLDESAPVQAEPVVVDELSPNATVIAVEAEIIRGEAANTEPVAADEPSETIDAPRPAAVVPDLPAEPEPETEPEPELIAQEPPESVPPRAAMAVSEVNEAALPDARTQTAIEVETLVPQAPAVLDTARRTYQVRSGDSLWNIARQFRPAGAGENLYQMLLSIHDLNRSSFVNGNISLLKANALLQIPATADVDAIDARTAQAEFDRRWEQGTQRFDAVQRGEAIPLFANDVPEDLVQEVEEELPPGIEAPVADSDGDALIMVSTAGEPQPLQLAAEAQALDAPAPDAAASSSATSASTEPDPFEEEPAPALTPDPAAVQASVAASDPAPAPASVTTSESVDTQSRIRVVTRAAFAMELETELAAMRARRQSAEAVAQQLQAALQDAQAARAEQASLLGTENLMLAGSALLLLTALLAAVVFSLKIAGDLRLRSSTLLTASLDSRTEPTWMNEGPASAAASIGPTEPRAPEMEVVELRAVDDVDASAPGVAAVQRDTNVHDDLFARMEDMLGDDAKSPKIS